ncbi:hypothetical protein D3C74_488830 [compost metagenome]
MSEIILITFEETDERTGKRTGRILVSHGVDETTLENIVLPCEPVQSMGEWSERLNEWILR